MKSKAKKLRNPVARPLNQDVTYNQKSHPEVKHRLGQAAREQAAFLAKQRAIKR